MINPYRWNSSCKNSSAKIHFLNFGNLLLFTSRDLTVSFTYLRHIMSLWQNVSSVSVPAFALSFPPESRLPRPRKIWVGKNVGSPAFGSPLCDFNPCRVGSEMLPNTWTPPSNCPNSKARHLLELPNPIVHESHESYYLINERFGEDFCRKSILF